MSGGLSHAVAVAVVAAGVSAPASAETAAAPPLPAGSTLSVGAGAVAAPAYPGARRLEVSPTPYLNADVGPNLSIDTTDGIRYTALRVGGLTAGPFARYRPGRSTSSLLARLRGLDGLKDAGELGGFATWETGPFALDLIGTEDIVSGHRGAQVETRATLSLPFGDPASRQGVVAGPFLKLGNQAFLQKTLGVSPAQAAATGLPVFRPDAGLSMAGLEADASVALRGRWSLRGFANWGRLVGDAGKSPLVRDGGRRDQIASGLFLVFTP